MSENVDETKPAEETADDAGAGEPAGGEEKKPESDVDRAKENVKDAASEAKEKLGEVGEKLKDEDVKKKVSDAAGKLKGLRRRI